MHELNVIKCFQTADQGLLVTECKMTETSHLQIADLFSSCFQGVQSHNCASFEAAMDAGQPVKVTIDNSTTLTDCKLNKLRLFSSTSYAVCN